MRSGGLLIVEIMGLASLRPMNANQPNSTAGDTLRSPSTQSKFLNVVIAYDGLTGAIYAHEAIGSLAMALGHEVEVNTDTWSFAMLQRLDLRHVAVREAAVADLIIVSATSPLPPHVESWLITCMREAEEQRPMIAALYPEMEGPVANTQEISACLSGVAARWRSPFLCNTEIDRWIEEGHAAELVNRKPVSLSQPRLDYFAEQVPTSYYGGINE